ncbi:uncharacterized protein [Dermacentor albipictus]|uniref:uncharacterized protein n=1 Tax=Dermacentor albipictus TaxID=60249 RepID=UPI0038FC7941
MTHILVKWVSIDAWDVYPIRSLVDVEAGRRLIENPAFVDCMAGRVYRVQCAPDVEPDEAFIIGIGSEKSMEKRRNGIPVNVGDIGGRLLPAVMVSDDSHLTKRVMDLEAKNVQLELTLDAAKMVKRLQKIIDKVERTPAPPEAPEAAAQVDIGNGVIVPRIMLQKWKAMCPTAPRFARALLRCVFSEEELKGSSLYGRPCNNRPDAIRKPALDRTKVDTIIAYTCSTFGTSDTKVKASLATMLAKGK